MTNGDARCPQTMTAPALGLTFRCCIVGPGGRHGGPHDYTQDPIAAALAAVDALLVYVETWKDTDVPGDDLGALQTRGEALANIDEDRRDAITLLSRAETVCTQEVARPGMAALLKEVQTALDDVWDRMGTLAELEAHAEKIKALVRASQEAKAS